MDEEKKSEASGDEPERLGPYLIQEQVQQSHDSQVEHTDWARAQDRQSAESLLLTLESVLEEVRRMTRAVSDTHEPRLRWSLRWGMASATASTSSGSAPRSPGRGWTSTRCCRSSSTSSPTP